MQLEASGSHSLGMLPSVTSTSGMHPRATPTASIILGVTWTIPQISWKEVSCDWLWRFCQILCQKCSSHVNSIEVFWSATGYLSFCKYSQWKMNDSCLQPFISTSYFFQVLLAFRYLFWQALQFQTSKYFICGRAS